VLTTRATGGSWREKREREEGRRIKNKEKSEERGGKKYAQGIC
jgi:hypothetical protein